MILIVMFELRIVSRCCSCHSMGEGPLKTDCHSRLGNRAKVTHWYRPVAERNVTLRADELRTLVLLIDFVVENSTVI